MKLEREKPTLFVLFSKRHGSETWFQKRAVFTEAEMLELKQQQKLTIAKVIQTENAISFAKAFSRAFKRNRFFIKGSERFVMTKREIEWFKEIKDGVYKGKEADIEANLRIDCRKATDIFAKLKEKN